MWMRLFKGSDVAPPISTPTTYKFPRVWPVEIWKADRIAMCTDFYQPKTR